jgi:hypothetical protein
MYGDATNMYGFGVSAGQLNHHVISSSDRHVFYAGGSNGNGTELMRIQGDRNVVCAGNLLVSDTQSSGGIQAHVGIARMGNVITNYSGFAHQNGFNISDYALLQSDLAETFLNCRGGKNIWFRTNNQNRGVISDDAFTHRNDLNVKYAQQIGYTSYSAGDSAQSNYTNLQNITFQCYPNQTNEEQLYHTVIVSQENSPFVQALLPVMSYGPTIGNAFRLGDVGDKVEFTFSMSGYASNNVGVHTINLQFWTVIPGVGQQWLTFRQITFGNNLQGYHQRLTWEFRHTIQYPYVSYFRITGNTGWNGNTNDICSLSVRMLPRQTI